MNIKYVMSLTQSITRVLNIGKKKKLRVIRYCARGVGTARPLRNSRCFGSVQVTNKIGCGRVTSPEFQKS